MPFFQSLSKIASVAAVQVFLSCCLLAAQGVPAGPSPRTSFLREDVEFLADSLCGGRGSGTPGYGEAAAYVARRMDDIPGLKPGPDGWFLSFETSDGRIGHNVIGYLPATSRGAKARCIVVMAALDGRGTLSGRLYPGADSDASGVAAMLDIAGRLAASPVRPRSVLFVALDGHCRNSSGAAALLKAISSGLVPDPVTETPLKTSRIDLVANLDIIGSTLSPVLKYYKEYLIVLGGSRWERRFESLNAPYQLHLTYDYYGSRDFTNLFYRKTGDHKPFLDAGIHCLVFTSGITMRTNKPTDDAPSLNYTALEKRTGLISEFLLSF